MKKSSKNYDTFINNKIDAIINNLRENDKYYKAKLSQYNKLYHELYKELTPSQMQKLDTLLNISNSISGDELALAYKIASNDTQLKNSIIKK